MKRLKAKDSRLTGTILKLSLLIVIAISAGACQTRQNGNSPSGESLGKITYETYIINHDTADSWKNECLSDFNRKGLIDHVFKAVLDGKLTPVDYFTGEKISPGQVRKMEKEGEFSREKISQVQFEEQWLWDDEKSELHKQLISMTIAYDVYSNLGVPRGQKPIFKIIFKR